MNFFLLVHNGTRVCIYIFNLLNDSHNTKHSVCNYHCIISIFGHSIFKLDAHSGLLVKRVYYLSAQSLTHLPKKTKH